MQKYINISIKIKRRTDLVSNFYFGLHQVTTNLKHNFSHIGLRRPTLEELESYYLRKNDEDVVVSMLYTSGHYVSMRAYKKWEEPKLKFCLKFLKIKDLLDNVNKENIITKTAVFSFLSQGLIFKGDESLKLPEDISDSYEISDVSKYMDNTIYKFDMSLIFNAEQMEVVNKYIKENKYD